MRLRKNRLQKVQIKHRNKPKVDDEGNTFPFYSSPNEIEVELWPMRSKLQFELYGERAINMMNGMCEVDTLINKNDQIIYDNDEYLVVSKKKYSDHIYFEIERTS